MDVQQLKRTAKEMVAPDRGILAMDESTPTCQKRFAQLNVECTKSTRMSYRSMLVTTPDLPRYISGAILFDETIREPVMDDIPFAEYLDRIGIVPGIKVDKGAKPLAGHDGEMVTEGLDGLRERLSEYVDLGARFAKWRAVIAIGSDQPSAGCIMANAHALARYAALCQEASIVPIVEPEVLMDGDHTIETCRTVTSNTLAAVYSQLEEQKVILSGTILKPNMVLAGKDCPRQPSVDEVAKETVECLKENVPPEVPGIAFLSGGQTDELATLHLNAINKYAKNVNDAKWRLTFSYGRALQQAPMKAWSGDDSRTKETHDAALQRAMVNAAASKGDYSPDLETAGH